MSNSETYATLDDGAAEYAANGSGSGVVYATYASSPAPDAGFYSAPAEDGVAVYVEAGNTERGVYAVAHPGQPAVYDALKDEARKQSRARVRQPSGHARCLVGSSTFFASVSVVSDSALAIGYLRF